MMRAVGPVTVCALVAVLGVPATQRLWAVKQLVHDTGAKPVRALFFWCRLANFHCHAKQASPLMISASHI